MSDPVQRVLDALAQSRHRTTAPAEAVTSVIEPEIRSSADLLRDARRQLAQAGARARNAALTPEERAKSASFAAKKRWANHRRKRKTPKAL